MKLLFVSDNHGGAAILTRIKAQFGPAVAALFHCGDSNLPESDPAMAGYLTVIGNTDWGLNYLPVISRTLEKVKVVVTHGHEYQVNTTLTPLMLLAKEQAAAIMAFGHTHQLGCEVIKGTLYLNPGSISQPRGQYAYLGGTFAVVEVTASAFNVQYYDRNLTPVPELSFHLAR